MAKAAQSTQSFVYIQEIRDDVLILRGKGLRTLLLCSTMNLALKAQDEQDAIIFEFQNFLNSLDFNLQICVSSRYLNVGDYVEMLEEQEKQQENDLLRVQTREYINFIREFVESSSIVSTDFYIVIPFEAREAVGVVEQEKQVATKKGGKGQAQAPAGGPFGMIMSLFGGGGGGGEAGIMPSAQLLHLKAQLMQRVDFVRTGLHRVGISTKVLGTDDLIMLFWNMYNPQNLQKRSLMRSIYDKE